MKRKYFCISCDATDEAEAPTFLKCELILHKRGWRIAGHEYRRCKKCNEAMRQAKTLVDENL